MINVNDFLESEDDMELCLECDEKVCSVMECLDELDEVLEDDDLDDEELEYMMIEILDSAYEHAFDNGFEAGYKHALEVDIMNKMEELDEFDNDLEEDEYQELDLNEDGCIEVRGLPQQVYNITLNIENLNGSQKDSRLAFNEIVAGLKKMGKV